MMLSKVAERVYWFARYIERIENTARLISIYDQLLFDLPRHIKISWYNLVTINSLETPFEKSYSLKNEPNVMRFLVADTDNHSSILSSLKAVRENIRTTRDVVPEDTWELINELYLYVNANHKKGIIRGARHEFLGDIVKGCQQIQGLLASSMPQDAAWEFVVLGRTLERADMTTRILDAGMAAIMSFEASGNALANTQQLIWGCVLRSVNADQAYRRNQRSAVHGNLVAEYLVYSTQYPRAISFCVDELINATANLPKNSPVFDVLMHIKRHIAQEKTLSLGMPLRDLMNELQIQLGDLHLRISDTWFPKW